MREGTFFANRFPSLLIQMLKFQKNKAQLISERWNSDQLNTSWTVFSTYLSSKLDSPSPIFWLKENYWEESNPFQWLIRGEYNFDYKYVDKSVQIVFKWCSTSVQLVFNWSEFHLSKLTCYKIHSLTGYTRIFTNCAGKIMQSPSGSFIVVVNLDILLLHAKKCKF